MYAKLAWRNVLRQLGNYMIYFLTVSLTIALTFSLYNVIFSQQLIQLARYIADLKSSVILISIFIAIIVAFVLGYANSFLLKLRKKEFGMYMTLGMTRKNVCHIFLVENLFIGFFSLALGILIGMFLYQGMIQITMNILGYTIAFADYSAQGLLVTIIMVIVLFLLSSLTSIRYLRKASILTLLQDETKKNRQVKYPVLWFVIAFISLLVMIGTLLFLASFFREAMIQSDMNGGILITDILLMLISVYLFHVAVARSIVNLLLHNKKFVHRGTNTFVLRQVRNSLASNSSIIGVLAVLLTVAVVVANVSYIMKTSEEASMDKNYPYDVEAYYDGADNAEDEVNDAMTCYEAIIAQYSDITQKIDYKIYTNGQYDFCDIIGVEHYQPDQFIRESDMNALLAGTGAGKIQLKGGYDVVNFYNYTSRNADFSKQTISVNGVTYEYRTTHNDYPSIFYGEFLIVVPDEAVTGMQVSCYMAEYDLATNDFDVYELKDKLSYEMEVSGFNMIVSAYTLRETARLDSLSTIAIMVISMLYIALIFVLMTLAILALKVLSGLNEDRRRYDVLYCLGVDRKQQGKTLFYQTFIFFLLPFVLPLLFTIPVCALTNMILVAGGYSTLLGSIVKNAVRIVLLLSVIYTLYYTATLRMAKSNVIMNQRR